MLQNPPQFTSPSGRPEKTSMATQVAMDKWIQTGKSPPPIKTGESQYFYTSRITNALTNIKRGYDTNIDNTIQSKPIQINNGVKNTPLLKTTSKGRKSMGALLGIAGVINASAKRR
jgi:hypothetical protein